MKENPGRKITVKRFTELSGWECRVLEKFIDQDLENWLPYHTLAFARVTEDAFGYENFSLVAFDEENQVQGYVPQWKRGKVIESVPWRDKGGPLVTSEQALRHLVEETKKLVKSLGMKGFLWKDFRTDLLENYQYFVNVEIDLAKFTADSYWRSISNKVRGKIRSAQRNGLKVEVEDDDINTAMRRFYGLFMLNRKRLGVPVYPFKLFESYVRYMPRDRMKIFSVYWQDSGIASLILFHNNRIAVDAYSASNVASLTMRANDLLLFKVIRFCIEHGIRMFDFGADSPLQTSLIKYKLKWLGEKREIVTSYFGGVLEKDHNQPRYDIARWMVRKMPRSLYYWFSRAVVR